jgi:creatinine amidohydrolase
MESRREMRFELLRPEELLRARSLCPLVFLPIGPLEYHGPHLPVGVDPIVATQIAWEACRRLGKGIVMPTLYMGTERERPDDVLEHLGFRRGDWVVGMDFPTAAWKSQYHQEHLFSLTVASTLELLIAQEYRVITIVNGHGSENQIATIDRLARHYSHTTEASVLWRSNFRGADPAMQEAGHADLFETSLMLHFEQSAFDGQPLVDLSTLPPRSVPIRYADYSVVDRRGFTEDHDPERIVRCDPRDASAAKGGEVFDRIVRKYVQMTEETLQKRGWGSCEAKSEGT